MHLKRGILIAIEGIDGSGKSTLARTLHARLADSFPTILTKEPGGTSFGAHIRALVQEQKVVLDPRAEFLLFAADRAQHFATLVLPALAQNSLVISDRMADSSLAYQGYGRGLDRALIAQINQWAMQERNPDLVLYVRVPVAIARKRFIARNETLTSFEQEKISFIQRVHDGFEQLFAQRTNVITIDGTQDINTVATTAYEQIITWIKQQQLVA